MEQIQGNIEKIKTRMNEACARSGRAVGSVRLMAVCKGYTFNDVQLAIKHGIDLFGENKVQEAVEKWSGHQRKGKLHLIGHLQTNKVKESVNFFDVIESVDSINLLQKIHEEAKKSEKKISILIQVNVSNDPKKSGILSWDILHFFRLANPYLTTGFVGVEGLMTIVERTKDIEMRRSAFRALKKISDEISDIFAKGSIEHVNMRELSMGMTEDMEVAIEEGATIVRVGRGIFG